MNKRILAIVILTAAVLSVAVFVPPIVWSQASNTQPNVTATIDPSTPPGTEYVYAQGGSVILNLPPSSLYNKTNLRIGFMNSYANSTKGAENILDVRVWVPETSRYNAIAYINTNPTAVASLTKMYAGVAYFKPILVTPDDLKISTQDEYTVVNLTKPVNVQWGDPNPQSIKNLNFTIPPMTLYFTTTGEVYQQTVQNSTLPSGWNSSQTTWSAPGWASVSIPSWIGSAIPTAAIMMPSLYLVATRPLDIVETAQASGSFNTLLTALAAANLTDTLKGNGPFTVFAPTDAAFNALPAGTVDALLANKTALTEVLLYHVVSGKLTPSNLTSVSSLTTLQGGTLDVSSSGSQVKVNDATIVATIVTSNGVINVIDKVLIPK
jgi:uncharacterized surface protein with fasciclin (FAS1) repeats